MASLLLHLFAPGVKLPPGATQFSLSHDGLSWGWAFFVFVFAAIAVAWSYRRFAAHLPRFPQAGLVLLRCLLIALLLLLLVRPVLLITIEDSVRRPLLVLLDRSQSMTMTDQRATADDRARAALALGLIDPAGGLKQALSDDPRLQRISRAQLLKALAANQRLNLWPRLQSKADLTFYGFGRKLGPLGDLAPPEGAPLNTDEAAAFFDGIHDDENLTSLGDALRDLLDQMRGQPIAGVLIITDGANNNGSSPIAAATTARDDGVPLFIYGMGVASPQDILVTALTAPRTANLKERVEVSVHIRAESMNGRQATVLLKANGVVVDRQPVEFRADGDQDVTLGYTPDAVGEVELEADVPPLPEEVDKDNNSAKAHVRVVDDKTKVLLVEDKPSWDYRYLVALLQGDRRVKLNVVLVHGDPGLATEPDSIFLDRVPDDKTALDAHDVILIGDVNPADLGDARMKLLADWVGQLGGGLGFLAGPGFDPKAYRGTPLQDLLPVDPTDNPAPNYDTPVQLTLTPAGALSPLLKLSDDATENASLWAAFTGVDWTAWVGQAKPGAQVLLTDPTPARANLGGPMPAMALQTYGSGVTLYVGFDQTYRWRSRIGGVYFTRLWSQIIQALSGRHDAGASTLTQLRTDRAHYLTGDRVTISGRILNPGFIPLTDAEVPGTLTLAAAAGATQPTTPVQLEAVPDQPGQYQGQVTVQTAGSYTFAIARDPNAALKFDVTEPDVEMSDIAMNEKLLRQMAEISGGQFLREEDLHALPEAVATKAMTSASFQKIPLVHTPWLFAFIIAVACAEWLWRRKLELK
jgi:uncharacterized membrane protein